MSLVEQGHFDKGQEQNQIQNIEDDSPILAKNPHENNDNQRPKEIKLTFDGQTVKMLKRGFCQELGKIRATLSNLPPVIYREDTGQKDVPHAIEQIFLEKVHVNRTQKHDGYHIGIEPLKTP